MQITQIIYSSRPFGFDDTSLTGILMTARALNPRDGITGALICRRDVFLQLLEGPDDKIAATLMRIRGDDRHVEMQIRYSGTPEERMFGEWAMLHDPATSWIWSMEQVAEGVLDTVPPEAFLGMFAQVAQAQAKT